MTDNPPPLPAEHKGRRVVLAETREEWRAWLVANAATSPGIWLAQWKQPSGLPAIGDEGIVEEALSVGWVDSRVNRLDDWRSLLMISPRKRGSAWSRPNKERVERLTAAGLMLPAGLAAVEAAKADGTSTKLDQVENLIEPPELAAALDLAPDARRHWDAFPRSAKRGILEWIVQAKRDETRARRIQETVRLAAQNIRANMPRQPTGGA